MKMRVHAEPSAPSRRGFLKTVAVTGGSAAVVLGAGPAVADIGPSREPESAEREAVYRETPHIRDYYTRANF
jgi:hypothetical protein